MTAKALYEAMLVELNKVNAPSLLLEDYNYFINKAVNQYVNKVYNNYDITQQTTDDLRVLKSSATLKVKEANETYEVNNVLGRDLGNFLGATFETNLPDDYLHMLNCLCLFEMRQDGYKCYPNSGEIWAHPATKLTADAWSSIYNNAYMCPTYRRPYYYIHNVNQQNDLPTNIYNDKKLTGTDQVDNIVKKTIEQTDKEYPHYYVDDEGNRAKVYWSGSRYKVDVIFKNSRRKFENPDLYQKFFKEPESYDEDYFRSKLYEEESLPLTIYHAFGKFSAKNSTQVLDEDTDRPLTDKEKKEIITFKYQDSTSNNEFNRTINLSLLDDDKKTISTIPSQKPPYTRHANQSRVRLEIRYGKDSSVFKLIGVIIDYIKAPQHIKLTQEQIDLTLDTSQVLEFPDYVCQEIINELVTLVLENEGNVQRVQSQKAVSMSIAQPAQPQATPQQTS